jgi:N-acylneuraminate cytidylyltransferase
MIRRALTQFSRPDSTADSLRAIRPVREHPAKMWRWEGPGYPIRPVWHMTGKDRTPLHSRPTQSLAPVYVQTSSLDMFWAANLSQYGTFGGRKIDGFLTDNIEGLALDEEDDWIRAEQLLASGRVSLPRIEAHSAPLSEAR